MAAPYTQPRIVHKAKHFREDGGVSAACFKRPQPIDMLRASWTTSWNGVTCAKCLKTKPPERELPPLLQRPTP